MPTEATRPVAGKRDKKPDCEATRVLAVRQKLMGGNACCAKDYTQVAAQNIPGLHE